MEEIYSLSSILHSSFVIRHSSFGIRLLDERAGEPGGGAGEDRDQRDAERPEALVPGRSRRDTSQGRLRDRGFRLERGRHPLDGVGAMRTKAGESSVHLGL